MDELMKLKAEVYDLMIQKLTIEKAMAEKEAKIIEMSKGAQSGS